MTNRVVHLGFDLGTTITKVTVLDDGGPIGRHFSLPTTWNNPGNGRFERDPADVRGDVDALLSEAASHLESGVGIASIGFTSMAESGVLVDRAGKAHSPFMAWHDLRGAAEAADLPSTLAHDFPAMTGLPVSHVASVFKLAWLRDRGFELQNHCWLSIPEYVAVGLGGRPVAERSMLGRTGLLDIHSNQPWMPILAHLGIGADIVPEIVGAGTPIGVVRDDHPTVVARGAVLTVAGHDHAVAAAACGCASPGSAFDSFGTAEAFMAAADHVPDPDTVRHLATNGISVYPHVVEGTTCFIGGTRTGLVLKRVLQALGAEEDPARAELDRQALQTTSAAAADITVTGYAMSDGPVTIGLQSDRQSPALVWRAAIDGGTAIGSALLDQMREAGINIDRLVVAGGWTGMNTVVEARRRMAPVVEFSSLDQPGTYGAARFAQWALALHNSPGEPAADRRPPSDWFVAEDQQ